MQTGEIQTVLLASGLVIFGKVMGFDLDSGTVALEAPMKITSALVSGKQGMQPVQVPEKLFPFTEEPLVLVRGNYLQTAPATKELCDIWLQNTTKIDLSQMK